ncbi:AAA family ATPase [Ruegeria arenilitoris]|uniref:bifunctional aminoglycoside phosphotransferase/ATP-binding protein n=1 Tax=Ruegeria arenilitoris TaxID=1173585 RepID=UPI001479DF29|nr:bifunctional aminoglycoside phosphotransferase/ATP-binding protein [Ruegeria arenilitoris]
MIVGDQSKVVAFLSDPATYGVYEPIEVIETHISIIFLAGNRAYKLKKAVQLPYADFSTPEIRSNACEKEFKLNKITSPEIYLGVRHISRNGSTLSFGNCGEVIDTVVEMVRFEQETILDQVALRGELTPEIMSVLAKTIAKAHKSAKPVQTGGVDNIHAVLSINKAGFKQGSVFTHSEIDRLDEAFQTALKQKAGIFEMRAARGCIKRCHGDLHLRNICLFDGEPRLFDCIDFNDQLATVDVLYDLAFLAMDLWHRDLRHLANLVVNHYVDFSQEEDGFPLLPYFIALRAAVRAHVLATQSEDLQDNPANAKRKEARTYYDLATSLLGNTKPRLVAIGGFSGSGKSTISNEIAPAFGGAPGARVIESDRARKAMFGVDPQTPLPEKAYHRDVSDAVYDSMGHRAKALLKAGSPVIVDAVFDFPGRRDKIENVAREVNVPFDGIWLDAASAVLKRRLQTRAKSASDATVDVLEMQLEWKSVPVSWTLLSTSCSIDETRLEIVTALGLDQHK